MKAYLEIDLEIDYDASPAEAQTLNYPGCDAEITLTEAIIEYVDEKGQTQKLDIIDALSPGEIDYLEYQAQEYETERTNPDNEV